MYSAVSMNGPRRFQIGLPDGRRLAWVEYGAPDGTPILYLHGGNDCGLEGGWFAGDLEPRIRLIAPDRPGFGRSTLQPGRRFADVIPDMEFLLDHLGIDVLPAFSLSGGGPHLLSLGAFCNRITRLGVAGGPCPYDTPGFLRGTWLPIRMAFLAARYAPDRLLYRLQQAMNDPRRNMRNAARMPRADAELFAQDPKRTARVIESVSAAHSQGFDGAVHEWRLYVQPWGFEPGAVKVPTTLWYGAEDRMAPPSMGEHLHVRIPASRLIVLPGEAHLSLIHRHARAIVNDLLADHVTESGRRG